MDTRGTTLRREGETWNGSFTAMASPCEVLVESGDRREAEAILRAVAAEARRIEGKFSRYLRGNIIDRINRGAGEPVEVDEETSRLLDFAGELHRLSEGLFDVTSGVLRRCWTFDGSDRVPSREAVREALALVGWGRVRREGRCVTLEPGMEIDLGGIGKEYAVDRAARLAAEGSGAACLVNFGGDLAVTGSRRGGASWRVGIAAPAEGDPRATRLIHLGAGALATSGDARRYLIRDGVRYGHLLDPRTGWPVAGAPRSVTVAAGTCVQAGMAASLAMLQGRGAEKFLRAQGLRHWITR